MFINDAFAQTSGVAAAGSPLGTLVQLILIFVIFYFILIRPQQKKIRAHEEMLKAIKVGDKIITGGGVFATVQKAKDDELEVKVAENVNIVIFRSTVREVINENIAFPTTDVKYQKASKKKK